MPELQWDELDFLECLGVVPEEGEYGTSYAYKLERNGLRLELSLWPFESMAGFSLYRETDALALFTFALAVRGNIRRVNDKRGDYLEFTNCIVVADRFSYLTIGNPFDRERFAAGTTLELFINPDIRFSLVD
jgi:hypothetical protein